MASCITSCRAAGFRSTLLLGLLVGFCWPAQAAKVSSTGETCTSSGSTRRDGTDKDTGEKFNCLFDYCTYCSTSGGKIDCSRMVTEYSNARECRPAARAGVQPGTVAPGGAVLDPGSRTTRPRALAPRARTIVVD